MNPTRGSLGYDALRSRDTLSPEAGTVSVCVAAHRMVKPMAMPDVTMMTTRKIARI